jgi:glycolate oxidase
MADLETLFGQALPGDRILSGEAVSPAYGHDETLSAAPHPTAVVLLPERVEEVSAILAAAHEHRVPVTARGAGSGLSGAAIPDHGGAVVSFERFARILEVDVANGVAVVEPGVRLSELDAELAPLGLLYPVRPGEDSASLGGTVNTNAAGMRAVRYGVTRSHVLGLELVLPGGEVVRTGGKIVKNSSGYDLTQLVVGSEGTLALVTRIWLKLTRRPSHTSTLLVPFATIDEVTAAIPPILASGADPLVLEYIDGLTMGAIVHRSGMDLGIADELRDRAMAYLVIQLTDDDTGRLEEDTLTLGGQLTEALGALDVLVLPGEAATQLITAREQAFYAAKEVGFHDIIDVVVPRAALPEYVRRVAEIGTEHASPIVGCGHAGDGNVHMSVLQADAEIRDRVMRALLSAGVELGGAISGEHGIGRHKRPYFLALTDPVNVRLMRGIKATFDPHGILNPGAIFEPEDPA